MTCAGCGVDLAVAGGVAVWNDRGRWCVDCEATGAPYGDAREGTVRRPRQATAPTTGKPEGQQATPHFVTGSCPCGCGRPVPPRGGRGRPARYFSGACRVAAFRQRHGAEAPT